MSLSLSEDVHHATDERRDLLRFAGDTHGSPVEELKAMCFQLSVENM